MLHFSEKNYSQKYLLKYQTRCIFVKYTSAQLVDAKMIKLSFRIRRRGGKVFFFFASNIAANCNSLPVSDLGRPDLTFT